MTTDITRRAFAAGLVAAVLPVAARAQRRRRVVVRPNRIVVRPGHPIARAAALSVVVRPPRRTVVVAAPLVFLPAIAFTAVVVSLPARERLVWEDSETLENDEGWVESNFGVDDRGDAVYLQVSGRAQLNFAEVVYENGDVRVVDFDEREYRDSIFRLYEIPGVRNVKTVRLVARARSDEAVLRLYLNR